MRASTPAAGGCLRRLDQRRQIVQAARPARPTCPLLPPSTGSQAGQLGRRTCCTCAASSSHGQQHRGQQDYASSNGKVVASQLPATSASPGSAAEDVMDVSDVSDVPLLPAAGETTATDATTTPSSAAQQQRQQQQLPAQLASGVLSSSQAASPGKALASTMTSDQNLVSGPTPASPHSAPAPSQPLGPTLSGVQIQGVQPYTDLLLPISPRPASPSTKPYMLLLPDLDGVGMTSRRSWAVLSEAFDLQVLTLSTDYGTAPTATGTTATFSDLVSHITQYLTYWLEGSPVERPIYLCGEGFGAVVALGASLSCPLLIHRLLLVNPSTSYLSSPLRRLQPLLAQGVPSPLAAGLPLVLAPALVATADPRVAAAQLLAGSSGASVPGQGSGSNPAAALAGVVQAGLGLLRRNPAEVATEALQLATATLDQVQQISSHLPPAALLRRLELLAEGVEQVTPRLRDVEQRTMLLIGGRDPVLPSQEEGEKLAKEMQRAFVKLLPESGHCPLSEAGVDVVDLLQQEGFLIQRRVFTSDPGAGGRKIKGSGFGQAGPIELPTRQEVARAGAEWTSNLRTYNSPVFFSTLEDGRVVEGLDGLPVDKRPLLVVGNHQLYAFDMNIMVEEVLLQRGLMLRGLAHPTLFEGMTAAPAGAADPDADAKTGGGAEDKEKPQQQGEPITRAMANTFRTFGAVEVSGKNYYKLLQNNEAVLLYPGGVREGFKRKLEKYELFWPSKPEFVRMAARFEATVVPLAAVGLEDSVSLVLDSDELLANPFLGRQSRELAQKTRNARGGVNEDPDNDQSFVPPIIAPNVPQRFYFIFGRPVRLTKDLYNDREAAQHAYNQIKKDVQDGIGYLLRKRELDPYKDFLRRYLYENPPLGGAKRKAPTFNVRQ